LSSLESGIAELEKKLYDFKSQYNKVSQKASNQKEDKIQEAISKYKMPNG
jgi:hypothetical protein